MPAVVIFRNFTTRPFAGDDMHITCLILGLYRAVQFICLFPLWIHFYLTNATGENIRVNGVPPWCSQYYNFNYTSKDGGFPLFRDNINYNLVSHDLDAFLNEFLSSSIAYFFIDVAWMIMVWHSASIGTPTEPKRRDVYIRNLIIFKMLAIAIFPLALITLGVYYVNSVRSNNYMCGPDGEPVAKPDEGVWYGLFSALLIMYAMEVLMLPVFIVNKLVGILKINMFWDRSRVEGRGGKGERFEKGLGAVLKILSCLTRGKAGGKDLKNEGELSEFAHHLMGLLNNQIKMDFVLTDIYVGMRMLSNVQAERKVDALKKMATKSKFFPRQFIEGGDEHELTRSEPSDDPDLQEQNENDSDPCLRRRSSIRVVQKMLDASYEVCEREVLQNSNPNDRSTMSNAAHFAKYASHIYVHLPNYVIDELLGGEEEECTDFKRELDTLFVSDEFRLTSIGLDFAILCYANFVNGIVATPYAIMIDEEMEKIVITVRGTRSLEDLVVDVNFIPESLEKVGRVCGFQGEDCYSHKGFLARSKWMYNDIKKCKVLKTLYSEQSPFKEYNLILCGHSLGAGCASILALMLRPSFPSVQCFAYEPPGCIFDDDLAEKCADFITSFVRHDDLVPRLSYHNFDTLRDEFFNVFARIKVPKIMLYFHLKEPYSDRFVAASNAKVLRLEEDIPSDTQFSKQLELFRAERAKKNRSGVNRVQLFIPGKIVHLVDISGDGNYIPYWANKGGFNQLEISKRMYADHDIHSLVKILRETRLGGDNTFSLGFHNAPLIYVDDEADSEFDDRLFACCSNPYGKLPIILAFVGILAASLTASAGLECDFFRASVDGINGTLDVALGIYTYALLDCDNLTGPCDKAEDYMKSTNCVPYPQKWDPGRHVQASRVFHTLAGILASLAVSMLLVSMCFIFKQRTWRIVTALFLGVTLFQSLVFLIQHPIRETCSEETVTHCSIGADGVKMITACCLWFLISVGSGYLAKTGKISEHREEKVELQELRNT